MSVSRRVPRGYAGAVEGAPRGVRGGQYVADPEADEVVVFLIGMRINRFRRPRSWWPTFVAMPRMLDELSKADLGLLGHRTFWSGRVLLVVQYWRSAAELGAYARRPMFARVEPDGVRWPDGSFERADVILWATGFRPTVGHLRPLHLRSELGGIRLVAPFDEHTFTTSTADPRIHFVGYGPSASTIGANRAGRAAARAVRRQLARGREAVA